MRHGLICLAVAVAAVVPVFGGPISVNLNSASSFALLGGTISNTGTSNIVGNVGAPTKWTDYGTWSVAGTVYPWPSDPTVAAAYSDFKAAFTAAMLLSSTQSLTDLTTSQTFIGDNVYTFTDPSISTTTGINLTFDAENHPNDVFVIRISDALTVNGAMTFTLKNGAQPGNIFWIVGTDATISVGSAGPIDFYGDILAGDTFTMSAAEGGSGVLAGTINGCVFAENANTLAGTTDVEGCNSAAPGGDSGSVPEPGTLPLLSMGLGAGFLLLRKFRPIR
jgi:hypothetical protein